jgi:hypothetical protein
MAKIPRAELDKIVKKQAPGYVVARGRPAATDGPRQRAPAQAGTPDLAQLKKRYGKTGVGAMDAARKQPRAKAVRPQDDDEVVMLEPSNSRDSLSRASRPKAVIVSGKDKKIIGRQG